jgi:RES domain-containing protein
VLDRLDLLNAIEAIQHQAWEGIVWRHMFADNPPTRVNDKGARWNPAGVLAIYCSLDRATALAEGDYAISLQPLRPSAKRTIFKLRISLNRVLDLSTPSILRELGLSEDEFLGTDHMPCRRIGGAVEWLEHDGMLVPSARSAGRNLVVFPRNRTKAADFEVLDTEVISEPPKRRSRRARR